MNYLERWPLISAFCITLFIVFALTNVLNEEQPVIDSSALKEEQQVVDSSVLKEEQQVTDSDALKEEQQVADPSALKEKQQSPDFASIKNIQKKKRLFFSFVEQQLKPINNSLADSRNRLMALYRSLEKNEQLSSSDERLINDFAENYHVEIDENQSPQQLLKALLLRIDVVPPALVLAQAASESGWGTSRFAREANNYFGIWCYKKGCGLIPGQRGKGQFHEVKVFPSVKGSVWYYVKLLNGSDTYTDFRAIRAQKRESGEPITALSLLPGLSRYSERGEAYLKDLSSIIRFNKLDEKYPLSNFP